MIEYRHKWDGERYVRVAKPAETRRVVELEAAQVRGPGWLAGGDPIYSVGRRVRIVALQDHHQPASGAGRTTPKSRKTI